MALQEPSSCSFTSLGSGVLSFLQFSQQVQIFLLQSRNPVTGSLTQQSSSSEVAGDDKAVAGWSSATGERLRCLRGGRPVSFSGRSSRSDGVDMGSLGAQAGSMPVAPSPLRANCPSQPLALLPPAGPRSPAWPAPHARPSRRPHRLPTPDKPQQNAILV